MRSLLGILARRPTYRRLWLAEVVSYLGDWLSFVAVSLLALQSGQGALGIAVVFAAHLLPEALVSPVAGVVADRYDRRRVLVAIALLQTLLMLAMTLAAAARAVWMVQAMLFVRTALAGFVYPARQAALRQLVDAEELVDAGALDSATWSVCFAVGTALGGVAALAGPEIALALDAASFLAAAMFFSGLPPLPVPEGALSVRAGTPLERGFGAMRAAWRHATADGALLEATFGKASVALATGGGWVLLNLRADELGVAGASTALALGALHATRAVGTGVGPIAGRAWLARGTTLRRLIRVTALGVPLTVAAFAVARGWVANLAASLVWGCAGGALWVATSAQMQKLAEPRMTGRVFSLDMLTFTLGMAGAALAAGALVDAVGRPEAAAWLGVAAALAATLGLRFAVARADRARANPRSARAAAE
jgi:MFS family permease